MDYKEYDVQSAVPNDYTESYDPRDIEDNRVFALLSYIGILFLVPMFLARRSWFARFHANQGLVLFLASALYNVFSRIVVNLVELIFGFMPIVPGIVSFVLGLVSVLFFVLMVLGILNAVNGGAKELPLIGHFRLFK